METLFLFCAIFGGTILVAQFLMGFGGDHEHGGDGAEDSPDHAGDMHADADAGDVHADGHHDSHQAEHHGSTWMFGVLTFRTVMIGLTFFGLSGKAASAS
jgi:hypothetical protein